MLREVKQHISILFRHKQQTIKTYIITSLLCSGERGMKVLDIELNVKLEQIEMKT